MTNEVDKQNRIDYLDSARGIAAFMVMIYHFSSWKYADKTVVKWSHLLFNGSDAVSFFFVLSGFVLAFPYLQKNKPLEIDKFYIHRIFRIYPAFLFVLLINALYWERHDFFSQPFSVLSNVLLLNKTDFWQEALLIRGNSKFLGLDWTLTIEIVMSFFMPFFILMVRQRKQAIVWFVLSYFSMSHILGYYVLPFALGILISAYFQEIQSPSFKLTVAYRFRYTLLGIATVFFSIRHLDRLFPFSDNTMNILRFWHFDFYIFSSVGAFILLVFLIHSAKAQRLLQHNILLFLGKISYGIYLVHWVVVAAIFDHWNQLCHYFPNYKIAFFSFLGICVFLTLVAATMLYYWVEQPLMQYGKKLTARMKGKLN